jgi:putative endonuclease
VRVPSRGSRAIGDRAEAAACAYLEGAGYRILWRNLRLGALELDVVAQREDLVAIVEVRTRGRTALQGALESVQGMKRRRLLLAADRLFRQRLAKDVTVVRVRIDIIAVREEDGGELRVEHFPGAIMG